jgi:ParB family chromosome partitioning protein
MCYKKKLGCKVSNSNTECVQEQDELLELALDKITVNPYQPRRNFKKEELEELAQSIKSVGLIHPPLVRYLSDEDRYELISGERRFRASQLAGKVKIPVFVRHSTDNISAQAALIENIQRVDLNPLEIAKALKRLTDNFGYSQDQLALKIGKKRSTVANYLRLLSLPTNIQNSLSSALITMGHAKAILALEDANKQSLLHELILRDDLSVREAEQAATRIGEKAKRKQLNFVERDFYIEQLAEKIQRQVGTKAILHHKGKKGYLSLYYYNLDDLDRLLSLLGVNQD